jgi:alpha-L-fucosidase 2
VKGLRARGGFEIEDLEWKAGKISRLVIKSNLGGNCRIRSYSPLKSEGNATLVQAEGENGNPLYRVPHIKNPLISPEARLQPVELRKTFLYDMDTKAGEEYVFSVL